MGRWRNMSALKSGAMPAKVFLLYPTASTFPAPRRSYGFLSRDAREVILFSRALKRPSLHQGSDRPAATGPFGLMMPVHFGLVLAVPCKNGGALWPTECYGLIAEML